MFNPEWRLDEIRMLIHDPFPTLAITLINSSFYPESIQICAVVVIVAVEKKPLPWHGTRFFHLI